MLCKKNSRIDKLTTGMTALTLVFATVAITPAMANKSGKSLNPFRGIASWYGSKFHGKKTASGKPFDQNDFTCAHRTLPFGTKLKVKNPENGKECTVEVTDRGPFKKNRVIDLSKAAARKLGITGVGRVVCSTGRAFARGVTPGDQSKNGRLTAQKESEDSTQ